MKKMTKILSLLALVAIFATSCTKEVAIPAPTTQDLIIGKFNTTHFEQEIYSNGVLDTKTIQYFNGYYFELRKDSSYSVNNSAGLSSGKWALESSNYLALDKNTSNERYFYVMYIDAKSFMLRGPFKKNGDLKFNYITNTYYEK